MQMPFPSWQDLAPDVPFVTVTDGIEGKSRRGHPLPDAGPPVRVSGAQLMTFKINLGGSGLHFKDECLINSAAEHSLAPLDPNFQRGARAIDPNGANLVGIITHPMSSV